MIKVTNVETFGWVAAIRGMRNSWNSWDKSDSELIDGSIVIGPNDLRLMQKLYLVGPSHRKYLRMIHVQMDVLAPLYYFKELDTYKVGTVANSTSTMHKIADHEFTLDDFSVEHLTNKVVPIPGHGMHSPKEYYTEMLIPMLNTIRIHYYLPAEGAAKKEAWWQMIQLLPESYNQLRTIDMNYENVFAIIQQRTGHKLDEWNDFVAKLWDLPYVQLIAGRGDVDEKATNR